MASMKAERPLTSQVPMRLTNKEENKAAGPKTNKTISPKPAPKKAEQKPRATTKKVQLSGLTTLPKLRNGQAGISLFVFRVEIIMNTPLIKPKMHHRRSRTGNSTHNYNADGMNEKQEHIRIPFL
ncbi:hypothetical protein AXF42_Ash014185 [Apostasia shenzhenica]|uniref:Uncharacterized protein n=1 Tax=Apostasia shenzhenica TaxID=1088818 RepID=A0A2I0A155_9ASPA|nr:hypothetical protein AXF42_Ash014185 [Apostasia shenzhenica]